MSGLPNVSFTLGQGGNGRPLQGFDHYSIMTAYYSAASANSAYASIGNKIYTSIQDAESDGVIDTCAEATAASSTQTVTAIGANGDTINISFTDWNGLVIDLGTYTKVTADSTATLVATGVVAAINARTYITGFSATVGSTGAWTVTAPKTFGIWPNTKSTTNTITGTIANTNAAFASGTKSNLAIFHYQIAEFFRGNPLGILYFSIKWDDSANAVAAYNTQLSTDLQTVVQAFDGNARQTLVYNPFRTFATSTLNTLKTLRASLQLTQFIPTVFEYVGGFTGALSAQVNLRALTDDGVGVVIGQSGSGVGFDLYNTQQPVISSGGLTLGIMSAAKVNGSIAENQLFNLSDGVECEIASFYDGTNFNAISLSLANQLHDFGYTFLRKFPGGYTGTYFNSGCCAVSPSSDYAFMEDCRTIDKAIRGTYLKVLDLLNSKNLLNPNGTLATAQIIAYNEKVDSALDQMKRDGEINDFTRQVSTTAIVGTTNIVPITIGIQQTPISRYINITIGFVATV